MDVPLHAASEATLTADQQEKYLQLIVKGASPAIACQEIGVPVAAVLNTLERDRVFPRQMAQVHVLLSQNVLAALYRSALKGSVPAQTLWLKNLPPPEWAAPEPADDESPDALDALDHAPVLTRFFLEGRPLPPGLAADLVEQVEADYRRGLGAAES